MHHLSGVRSDNEEYYHNCFQISFAILFFNEFDIIQDLVLSFLLRYVTCMDFHQCSNIEFRGTVEKSFSYFENKIAHQTYTIPVMSRAIRILFKVILYGRYLRDLSLHERDKLYTCIKSCKK